MSRSEVIDSPRRRRPGPGWETEAGQRLGRASIQRATVRAKEKSGSGRSLRRVSYRLGPNAHRAHRFQPGHGARDGHSPGLGIVVLHLGLDALAEHFRL